MHFLCVCKETKTPKTSQMKTNRAVYSTWRTPREGSLLGVLSRALHSPKPMPQKKITTTMTLINHGRKIIGNTSHK